MALDAGLFAYEKPRPVTPATTATSPRIAWQPTLDVRREGAVVGVGGAF